MRVELRKNKNKKIKIAEIFNLSKPKWSCDILVPGRKDCNRERMKLAWLTQIAMWDGR